MAQVDEGYEAVTLRHGATLLDDISERGMPSLILLDINMPVMSGLELLGQLTELGLTPRVPVILISTEGKEEDVLRAYNLNVNSYIRKPDDIEGFIRLATVVADFWFKIVKLPTE